MEEKKQGTQSDTMPVQETPKPADKTEVQKVDLVAGKPIDLVTGKPKNPDLDVIEVGMDQVHGLTERFAEQSRAIQAIDEHLRAVRRVHGQHARETDELNKSIERRLNLLDEFVGGFAARAQELQQLEERLTKLADDLGPKYEKRLNALGSQVAALVTVGQRVSAAERRAHAADRLATDLADLVKNRLGELEQIGKDLRTVMDKLAPRTDPAG